MKYKEAFIPTLREDPSDAEAISHKLMVRAGFIRRLGSGTYSYLPLGVRSLKKVESIVRDEMDKKGALEVLLPAIHPAEIWKKTGRLDLLSEILITYKDRSGKLNVFGPTHEEIITDLIAKEVRSYRDLPKLIYQIQTKFRDEPRPRFGVLRSKEFIMKDAYSFDVDWESLDKMYKKMYEAYCRIFERCGINYIPVEADSGFMGGDVSHEFMAPAACGEDKIAVCCECKYAASLEKAECGEKKPETRNQKPERSVEEVKTPGVTTVGDVSKFLKVKPSELVKTLIYVADGKPVAALVRGDHDLNEQKLRRAIKCTNLTMATEDIIQKATNGPCGFSGPVGLKGIKIVADNSVKGMSGFVVGANKKDAHLTGVTADRDFKIEEWADLRYIMPEDKCPKCDAKIDITTAIELGHIFKLGTKYTKALGAKYLDEKGAEKEVIMGCYGIGINRILAAAIEQNNDENGIKWPLEIAPYSVAVISLDPSVSEIANEAERVYQELIKAGVDVIMDDRDERPGIKFKDADLIGIPIHVIVGKKGLKEGKIELKLRATGARSLHPTKDIIPEILSNLK